VSDRRLTLGVILAVVVFLATPLAATAQQAEKIYRIAFLRRTSPEPVDFEAFRQGLRGLGYVEGQNVVIEQRYAHGAHERLPGLARELLELKVDVFVVDGPLTVRAVRQVAQATPVVFTVAGDPVGEGFAATLARPSGTITGLTNVSRELNPKRLQLLREVVPAGRVGVLYNPANTPASRVEELRETARSLDVELQLVEVKSPDALAGAFTAMRRAGLGAVLVLSDAMLYSQRARIVDLAAQHRLPAVYEDRLFAKLGGLMSYGPNISENFRRAAAFVDKILKGVRPGDLPIEQPTKFDLVINLKTANSLGLMIPPSLLLRADQVVQ
jgi:putative ABC transport system substrate-binding protein